MTDLRTWRDRFYGEVVAPGDPEFDAARRVHNGLIDRNPTLVVRPRGVAAVRDALAYARQRGWPIAVRGGGHSVAGYGTCDDGMVIDLSLMRGVRVDPDARRAWVQGGALLGDLDREAQAHGLATPAGQVANTGVAGLTLNGGLGCMQRKYGLTCDNLLSAEMVTADGEIVRASADRNPELFWALRGGGGNFGVVTGLEYQLHAMGPQVYAGMVAYPIEEAPEVLAFLRDFIEDAPEELSADALFQFAPPLEIIPEELLGRHMVGIWLRYCGAPEEGEEAVRPVREFGKPLVNTAGEVSYVDLQSMIDPLTPKGWHNYWTGEYIPRLGTTEIEAVARHGQNLPNFSSIMQVIPFNAAPTRVSPDETAFAHREESWLVHYMGQWPDTEPETETRCRDWARASGSELRELGDGRVYLNLVGDDEDIDRVGAFWDRDRHTRLSRVKAQYDPDNAFRFNHNISPG